MLLLLLCFTWLKDWTNDRMLEFRLSTTAPPLIITKCVPNPPLSVNRGPEFRSMDRSLESPQRIRVPGRPQSISNTIWKSKNKRSGSLVNPGLIAVPIFLGLTWKPSMWPFSRCLSSVDGRMAVARGDGGVCLCPRIVLSFYYPTISQQWQPLTLSISPPS